MDDKDQTLTRNEKQEIVDIPRPNWLALEKWLRIQRDKLASQIDNDRDPDVRNELVGQRKAYLRISVLKDELQNDLDKK